MVLNMCFQNLVLRISLHIMAVRRSPPGSVGTLFFVVAVSSPAAGPPVVTLTPSSGNAASGVAQAAVRTLAAGSCTTCRRRARACRRASAAGSGCATRRDTAPTRVDALVGSVPFFFFELSFSATNTRTPTPIAMSVETKSESTFFCNFAQK